MPPSRREFLSSLTALGAASTLPGALSGCGVSQPADGESAQTPPAAPSPQPPGGFDFPQVTPAPFAHGVASGDPLADRVIIWTRITEATPSATIIPVDWAVGTGFDDSGDTPMVTGIVRAGRQDTRAERDWTTKVDVTGLNAGTTYYYQFFALGTSSIIGRTRTAPDTAVESIRLAVVACSSYWSSHWSGYSHLAERNDLDLVVHCGDYIYDFVDNDEEVRARNDIFDTEYVDYRDWTNLDEVRRRYALYRSDPNHLRAHQQHPWSIIWDNHDISVGYGNELDAPDLPSTTTFDDVVRAFYEWTPSRPPLGDGSGEFLLVEDGSYPLPPNPTLLFRKLDYGPMADIFCLDTWSYTTDNVAAEAVHLPEGTPSKLGTAQYEWLTSNMLASAQAGKTWRLLINQHWLAPIDVPQVLPGVPTPGLGLSRWAGFTTERDQLFDFLRGMNTAGTRVANNVVVSGDTHGNWASDLIADNTVLSPYLPGVVAPNPRNGSTAANVNAGFMRTTTGNLGPINNRAESVGVEFAPTSMGRGGADELIANASGSTDPASNVGGARAIEAAVINGNKNCQFLEWVDHGYGIVHLTAESAIFEYWWQDKLTPGSPDVLGQQMIAFANDDTAALPAPRYRDQIDAVTAHGMTVAETQGTRIADPAPEGDLQPR